MPTTTADFSAAKLNVAKAFKPAAPSPAKATESHPSDHHDARTEEAPKPTFASKLKDARKKSDDAKPADDADVQSTDEVKKSPAAEKPEDESATAEVIDAKATEKPAAESKPEADDDAVVADAAQQIVMAAMQATLPGENVQAADAKPEADDAAIAATADATAAPQAQAAQVANVTAGDQAAAAKKGDATAAKAQAKPVESLASQLTPVDEPAPTTHSQAAKAEAKPAEVAEVVAKTAEQVDKPAKSDDAEKPKSLDDALAKLLNADAPKPAAPTPAKIEPPPLRPEQQFARDNVDRIVTSVQTHATTGSQAMRVRLDPPELGALDVAMKMVEGRMVASFTTSNDNATQLLSHSLGQLKSSLESAGINVDRIDVRQAAPAQQSSSSNDRDANQNSPGDRGSNFQQQSDQQRRQMVNRLWRKYAYGDDAVDLVA